MILMRQQMGCWSFSQLCAKALVSTFWVAGVSGTAILSDNGRKISSWYLKESVHPSEVIPMCLDVEQNAVDIMQGCENRPHWWVLGLRATWNLFLTVWPP